MRPPPFQIMVHVAIARFGKLRRRMARLEIEAAAFRKERDTARAIRIVGAWRVDAHGRGVAREKIVGMARRKNARVGQCSEKPCPLHVLFIVDPKQW